VLAEYNTNLLIATADRKQSGDLARGAHVMLQVVQMEHPPLRLPLGMMRAGHQAKAHHAGGGTGSVGGSDTLDLVPSWVEKRIKRERRKQSK
jgi:hypothetical protein